MCCSKALTYQVTKCVVWKHYPNEWQNVLFESITLYRVTKCVVWKHYPTISDKMCCLKALPYHTEWQKCVVWKHYLPSTEWQNVLFESINLPSDKMCCLKALTYWVTKCVVWKHYRTKWQNVLFESINPTVPSDKMCCYHTEWKHYPTIPSDKMCCLKALTYQVPKCVVWKH